MRFNIESAERNAADPHERFEEMERVVVQAQQVEVVASEGRLELHPIDKVTLHVDVRFVHYLDRRKTSLLDYLHHSRARTGRVRVRALQQGKHTWAVYRGGRCWTGIASEDAGGSVRART